MLQFVEQTPRRVVLRDQRPTAGLVALVFTFLSLSAVLMLLAQLIAMFGERVGQFDGLLWLLGMVMFTALGLGFVALGAMASAHFLIGSACMLDKDSGRFIIQRVDFFRRKFELHKIDGIRRIDVQENREVHAFGVFVVLKNGQRVPIASYHQQDEEAMRAMVAHLRDFLRDW